MTVETFTWPTQVREHYAMLCAEIGKALNRDSRAMVSTLLMLEKQGRIQKNWTGIKVTLSLPVAQLVTEPEQPTDENERPTPVQEQSEDLVLPEEAGAEASVDVLPQPVAEPEPDEAVQQIAESAQHESPGQAVAEVVGSIPSFTCKEKTNAFSEMLTAENREIRRTREKSERLAELREGIRHVRKHENLLQEVMAWPGALI